MSRKTGWFWLLNLVVCLRCIASDVEVPQETESVFSGSLGDAVWTVIAFLVLLLVLKRFAWGPLMAGLQTRADYIQKQITDAEVLREEAEKSLVEYKGKIVDAENEGRKISEEYLHKARNEAMELLEKARQTAIDIRQKTEVDIANARLAAQMELLTETGEIVMELGAKVLGRTIRDQDNQRLIDDAVKELSRQIKS